MSRNRKLEKLAQLEKLDYAHDVQDANLESDVRNIKDKMNGHWIECLKGIPVWCP